MEKLASLSCPSRSPSPKQPPPPPRQPPPPRPPFPAESPLAFLRGGGGASYTLGPPLYPHSHPGPRDFLPFPSGPPGYRHPALGGYPGLPPFPHPHPSLSFSQEMERFSSAYVAALAAAVSNKRHAPPPPPAHSSPPSPLPLPAEPPPIHRAAVVSEMGREQGRRQRDERGMEGLLAGMTRGQRTPSPHCTEPVGGRRDRCGDPLSLRCPLCQAALARAELRDHLHCEIQRLSTLNDSGCQLEPIPEPQYCDPSLSQCGGSEVPLGSPHSGDEEQKMDRQQIFLQVKTNREGRLGVRAGRFKRLKISDDEQESAGKALRQTDSEDDSVDLGYRSPAPLTHNTGHLDAPLRGDTLDSELDGLDSDPEDSLYPADPCQEADPSKRRKADTANGRAGHSEGETAEALRAQITQLTVRLQQRQTQRCHVCLDMYSVPVASIQCWHIHCEDCWLRSLGSKKLCPQCSTITSPGDLRRVFL